MQRVLQYGTQNDHTVTSTQEDEIRAFNVANTYLTECTDCFSRTKALHKNQQLWSLLVKDIMLSNNLLPQPVKDDLIRLGCWSMIYSIRAMGTDLPLAPLIDVNTDMIEALRRQMQNTTAAPIHAAAPGRMAV